VEKVSAVVPCYGEQGLLDMTLSTLMNQTVPFHEIIVVDDGSEKPIVVPHGIRLIRLERKAGYRGNSAAKNSGASHATGDYLCFSDNDILHMPDALESTMAFIDENPRRDMLTSLFSVAVTDDDLDAADWLPGDSGAMERLHDHIPFPSGNMAVVFDSEQQVACSEQHFAVIRKDYFDSLGGYDSAAFQSWGYNNQDLCLRILRGGGKLTSNVSRVHDPDAIAYCFHKYTDITRDGMVAREEFHAKHGTYFHPEMLVRYYGT